MQKTTERLGSSTSTWPDLLNGCKAGVWPLGAPPLSSPEVEVEVFTLLILLHKRETIIVGHGMRGIWGRIAVTLSEGRPGVYLWTCAVPLLGHNSEPSRRLTVRFATRNVSSGTPNGFGVCQVAVGPLLALFKSTEDLNTDLCAWGLETALLTVSQSVRQIQCDSRPIFLTPHLP